jgi:hypothetical protein
LNVPWNVLVDNGLLNILTHRLQQVIQQLDDSSSYHPDAIDIQVSFLVVCSNLIVDCLLFVGYRGSCFWLNTFNI